MRRVGLSLALILIAAALIGGFLTQVVPQSYVPDNLRSLGQYVGTNGSVAGAIFGLGLLWAATNPRAHRAWVLLWILYAVLLVAYQIYAPVVLHESFALPPIVFGLLGGGLVAALYPTAPKPAPEPVEAPVSPPLTEATTPAPSTPTPAAEPTPPHAAGAHSHTKPAHAKGHATETPPPKPLKGETDS